MKQASINQQGKPDNENQSRSRFEILFQRGTDMLLRGQTERAVQLLERANKLEPDHLDTAVNLGGAYILTKKFKRAVQILEPLSEREPFHAMVWTNLGAAYLGNPVLARDEEQLQAIEAFKQAFTINPATPNVAYNIGLIYRDRGEIDAAINWFGRAIQANPNDQDARILINKLSKLSKQD